MQPPSLAVGGSMRINGLALDIIVDSLVVKQPLNYIYSSPVRPTPSWGSPLVGGVTPDWGSNFTFNPKYRKIFSGYHGIPIF